jgi:putative salt-induced outer membrane protein YdiY
MNKWFSTIVVTLLSLAPQLVKAQKTDTLIFYNDDRAVCEIKSLSHGKLNIKTVAMGTITVEWRKIKNIISNKEFNIVLSDHTTFFGRIDGVDSLRNASLQFGVFTRTVPLRDIVSLSPINGNFWSELDGSISTGFSFIKGTQNLQLNSTANAKYRTVKTTHSVQYNANISANPDNRSEKQDAGYRFQYFHKKRFYNAVDLRWERNTELGIGSRLITTLSIGYSPIENNHHVFSVEIGGSANREFSTEGGDVTNNTEGLLRVTYDLFFFSSPKIFLNVKSETFPSFTVGGRIRSNFDTTLTWEIFGDFTINLSYWINYDSKPANETALTFDWGTTTSIGYTF